MKMLFGGVYKRKGNYFWNEQMYGIYIPVIYIDKNGVKHYRMVDTYEVEKYFSSVPAELKSDTEKAIWRLEQANCGETSWHIYTGPSNYYYKNCVDLINDELDENNWELIANLHDYIKINPIDAEEYSDEDLIEHIALFNEDGYSWNYGARYNCTYVKKDAVKNGWRMFQKAKNDHYLDFLSDWDIEKLINKCKECLTMKLKYGQKSAIKRHIKKTKKYLKLKEEFDQFCKELEK